jgi:hypothetical protein
MVDRTSRSRGAWGWLLGLALGALLAVGSLAWSRVLTQDLAWSPEQAAEYKAAHEALHDARSGRDPNDMTAGSDAHDGESKSPEFAAAEKRFNDISAALDDARNARHAWGTWGVGAGLALMIACGLGFLATRRE